MSMGLFYQRQAYDWQYHGRDGVAAVNSILLNLGFYPETVMQVARLTPPAVPTPSHAQQRQEGASLPECGLGQGDSDPGR